MDDLGCNLDGQELRQQGTSIMLRMKDHRSGYIPTPPVDEIRSEHNV